MNPYDDADMSYEAWLDDEQRRWGEELESMDPIAQNASTTDVQCLLNWELEHEYGPPTREADNWFTHNIVAHDYPKVKRDPEQLPGQEPMFEVIGRYEPHHAGDENV